MDRLDKYGFENPLELIGIDDIFDVESLRKKCDSIMINIKSTIYEKNKPSLDKLYQRLTYLEDEKSRASADLIDEYDKKIEKTKKDISLIRNQREKWYNDLDSKRATINSSDDISEIIYYIIKLSASYVSLNTNINKQKSPEEKKYIKAVNDLNISLKKIEDVKKFIIQRVFVRKYIDTEKRDLSRYAYNGNGKTYDGFPEYLYAVKSNEDPEKIFDYEDGVGDRVQAYRIGRFAFGAFMNTDHYTYNSGTYDLLTVLRRDKSGEIKTYNGIFEYNYNDMKLNPEFYGVVAFSDLALENAEKNNFGYIGTVIRDKNGERRLVFNENIESRDLVRVLSYAQKFDGRFVNLSECKTLSEFFEIMNQKINEITDIKLPNFPQFNDDEGGR